MTKKMTLEDKIIDGVYKAFGKKELTDEEFSFAFYIIGFIVNARNPVLINFTFEQIKKGKKGEKHD